jgi:PIN domain
VGSVLLLPEILAKPMRDGGAEDLTALAGLPSRLELRVVDAVTAEVATSLAATHRLRAADAVHLATAVVAGADRFVTNNRRDFPKPLPTSTSPTRTRCRTPQQADGTSVSRVFRFSAHSSYRVESRRCR